MSKHSDQVQSMIERNLLDYGSRIHRDDFMLEFGISPITEEQAEGQSLKQIQQLIRNQDLLLLAASDAVRSSLLALGRYFGQDRDHYRVALPTENRQIAANYIDSGNRKIARAGKLLTATPVDPGEITSDGARAAASAARAERLKTRL